MIRLGLCCKFSRQPITSYTTTATSIAKLSKKERLAKLSALCVQNAEALLKALQYCHANHIGAFRINSQILPLKTHPVFAYSMNALPQGKECVYIFKTCGAFAKRHDIRISFHPDQFILLSSDNRDIIRRSIHDLEYQTEVSEWVGADVINMHGGGAYGDKKAALKTVRGNLKKISVACRKRLTFENDDRVYTPADLLPLCEAEHVPFVYDVHHHRCLSDTLSEEEATNRALKTWNREPLFHISSPREGWHSTQKRWHHDYIDIRDFPDCWKPLTLTVEVEAKAKELAVKKLYSQLKRRNLV